MLNMALTNKLENMPLLSFPTSGAPLFDFNKKVFLPKMIFGILIVVYPLSVSLFEYAGSGDWGGMTQTSNMILGLLTSFFLLLYARRHKNFLVTLAGFGFLAGSLLDSLNLIFSSPRTHQLLEISTPFMLMRFSGTYLASPVVSGIIFIASPLINQKIMANAEFFRRKYQFFFFVVLGAGIVAAILCLLPLQKYFDPERTISRPVDLLPALFFAVALGLWVRRETQPSSILVSWIVLSLGLFVGDQLLLALSTVRFDFYYQLSLGYRQLATLAPVCGLVLQYFSDIDQLNQQLTRLQNEQTAFASADLAKSEFLTHVSHEIRTPINGIIGLTELVMQTPPSFQQRQYLQMLRNSAYQLMHPLGEILDLARIEAGHLELEHKNFNLRELAESVSDAVVHQADEKGLELTLQVQHDVPDNLEGDPRRLKQVLINLLDNAIKFSDHGAIGVKIYQTEKGRTKIRLHVTVTDQGIGIAPEFHQVIFQRFAQANAEIFQKYGGAGLGLTLARKIVTEMGGDIWVESMPGKGSTFHFTAILGIWKNGHFPEQQRDMRQAPVLVIESNPTTRDSLKEMLQAFECQVLDAADETEALDIFGQTDEIKLVLCDYYMPQPDALSFVSRTRNINAYRRVPIIFLVSIVADQATHELERLPQVWFLSKPVKQSQLFNVLLDALNADSPDEPGTVRVDLTPLATLTNLKTPIRILLVEDNRINQTVARGLLNKTGIFIDVVENGQRALDILKQKEFDIILMDVQMPEMDGLEATQKIREELNLKEIPIIAITAHALKGDRERCLAAGMNDYVSKPIRPEQLYQMINKWLFEKNSVTTPKV
jgi:signal transduction histidine kinase/CheY-like chemotaxis protein